MGLQEVKAIAQNGCRAAADNAVNAGKWAGKHVQVLSSKAISGASFLAGKSKAGFQAFLVFAKSLFATLAKLASALGKNAWKYSLKAKDVAITAAIKGKGYAVTGLGVAKTFAIANKSWLIPYGGGIATAATLYSLYHFFRTPQVQEQA